MRRVPASSLLQRPLADSVASFVYILVRYDESPPTKAGTIVTQAPYLDPDVAHVLHARTAAVASNAVPSSSDAYSVEAVRQRTGELASTDADLRAAGAESITELVAPATDAGPDVALTLLRPHSARTNSPTPVLIPVVYVVHGGGWVTGDRRTTLSQVAGPALAAGLAAVSVEYRLAPEASHEDQLADCWNGLSWLARNAAHHGLDPHRIAAAGSSAGGTLVAGLARFTRDRAREAGGEGEALPRITHQVLLSAPLDDRCAWPSVGEFDGGGMLDGPSLARGWATLLGPRCGGADVPVTAAPARASDLADLPPAFLEIGTAEPMRDEVIDYAARLARAGVPTELHVWPGAYHGSATLVPDAEISQAAVAARESYFRRMARA